MDLSQAVFVDNLFGANLTNFWWFGANFTNFWYVIAHLHYEMFSVFSLGKMKVKVLCNYTYEQTLGRCYKVQLHKMQFLR